MMTITLMRRRRDDAGHGDDVDYLVVPGYFVVVEQLANSVPPQTSPLRHLCPQLIPTGDRQCNVFQCQPLPSLAFIVTRK